MFVVSTKVAALVETEVNLKGNPYTSELALSPITSYNNNLQSFIQLVNIAFGQNRIIKEYKGKMLNG